MMNSELAECCIVCLEKTAQMVNLKESGEKLIKLSALSHVEFSNYMDHSHLLCTSCDKRLISSYSFLQQVLKSIQIIDGRKNKIDTSSNKEMTDNINSYQASRSTDTNPLDDSSHIRRTPTSSIKPVPIEDVNDAIEAFKKARGKCDNCLICGFTVSQRKYLIKHMTGHHLDRVSDWCRDCNGMFENIDEHRKTHSRKFACTFCGKMFRANTYVEHVMCHAGAFKCDMCGNMFNSSSSLKKHKFLHTNYRPHRCPNCTRGFLQASALRYHLINTHGKLNCASCMKHFPDNDKLLQHECVPPDIKVKIEPENESGSNVSELADKPEDNVVGKIEDSSDDTESLKDADETFGDPHKNFENDYEEYCEKCDKKVKNLERHVANYHCKLMCELCQKEFRSSYKLQLHIQIHKGTVPNECRYCQKKFHHKVKLVEHERTHTKEKPYECNFCQKSFTQKSVLNTHMKQHTGRPEVCDICGKRFCRKSELRLHLSKHTGEKPHLCSICGKNFGQKSHLSQHMISHREDRPHQCPFCEKAFKRNELLKGHLRLHSGNKPFKCSHCSYTCYRQYRLREHMKVHTGHSTSISETGKEDGGQMKC